MKNILCCCLAAAFLLQGCSSTKYIGYKSAQIDPSTLSGVLEEDNVKVLLSNDETVRGTIIMSTAEELALQMPDSVRKIPHRSIQKIVQGGIDGGIVFCGGILGGLGGALVGNLSAGSSRFPFDEKKWATVGGGCLGVLIGGVVGAIATPRTVFLYSSALRETLEVVLDGITVEGTTYFVGTKEGREYRFAKSDAVLLRGRFVSRVRGAREMFVRLGVPLPP
jgi:hypothetical protein